MLLNNLAMIAPFQVLYPFFDTSEIVCLEHRRFIAFSQAVVENEPRRTVLGRIRFYLGHSSKFKTNAARCSANLKSLAYSKELTCVSPKRLTAETFQW